MHLVFRLTNFHPVLLSPLPFSSVDSLSALGTMTASPDTMLFGSGKKSERSKTINTMITSKRNSGSQSGVKMKVTHRDAGELRTTQSPLCSSQLRDSGGPEGCPAPEVWFQTDDTQCGPAVPTGGYCYTRDSCFAQPNLRLSEWTFL